jgi:hypothetical protein
LLGDPVDRFLTDGCIQHDPGDEDLQSQHDHKRQDVNFFPLFGTGVSRSEHNDDTGQIQQMGHAERTSRELTGNAIFLQLDCAYTVHPKRTGSAFAFRCTICTTG